MLKSKNLLWLLSLLVIGCTSDTDKEHKEIVDSLTKQGIVHHITDSIKPSYVVEECKNDTLNAIARLISGIQDSLPLYQDIKSSNNFKLFSKNFDKRWNTFDSSRLVYLKKFREDEISKIIKTPNTLFYPFSGPDILYAQTFFPDANQYVMIGLEPVGSLPIFQGGEKDSINNYFNKINTSLNAILKFSFFRTESMGNDLRNSEVDGTLHLLLLFLKRTGNSLCSARPITIDTLGAISYLNTFSELKKLKTNTRGVEIKFTDVNHHPKTLYYYSLNAADGGLKSNTSFVKYLTGLGAVHSYLKGASYLLHKSYFSIIRNIILNQSTQITQDDSGIAFHYFTESNYKWDYTLYGSYSKPIPMFSEFYQGGLDTLYKKEGAKEIGFGIGYNFRDKNSNLMIATKKQ